jgi:hypothetical protein
MNKVMRQKIWGLTILAVVSLSSSACFAEGLHLVRVNVKPSAEAKNLQMLDPAHPLVFSKGVALEYSLGNHWAIQISPEEVSNLNRSNGLSTPRAGLIFRFD